MPEKSKNDDYFKPPNKIYKLGEPGSGLPARGDVQDFNRLREECLRKGALFKDPNFQADDSSMFFSKNTNNKFVWKRPQQISDNPKLLIGGASRFDIQQGDLGDCWLLAAMANLTLYDSLFKFIVPQDQSFSEKYAGIFHFRFWQYGRWFDIVIDDRLPTYKNKLIYLHSTDPNEYWSALLEKAYAKLHGSYESLKGGSTCEAMEDVTGGVTETYQLNESVRNLFNIMSKAYARGSLMGCSVEPDPNVLEAHTPQGLIKGHAYSVTFLTVLDSPKSKIQLIRLRNPWGDESEWNGAWSDKSQEWKDIPNKQKKNLGLTFEHDGEFWMSFNDFLKYFSALEICNLSPESTSDPHKNKTKWVTNMFEGEWVQGVTAGGCRNFIDTFWHNPQYRITLKDPDEEDDDDKCTIVVALMQKNRRIQRQKGMDSLTIGFSLYLLKTPEKLPKPLDLNFFKYSTSIARAPSFINLREVSARFKLPEGVYCIIPSTYDPNQSGEFLLRVCTESKTTLEENDETIGIGNVDISKLFYQLRIKYPQLPKIMPEQVIPLVKKFKSRCKYKVPVTEIILYIFQVIKRPTTENEKTDSMKAIFCKVAGNDMEVDWMELREILNYSSSKDKQPFNFSKDVCRSMVAMMDIDRSGKLGFYEFKALWQDICEWKTVFKLYDNGSGLIGAFELRQALNSAGYSINNHLLNALVYRYSAKENMMSFDGFMICAVRLKAMISSFMKRDPKRTKNATISMEDWVELTLYS